MEPPGENLLGEFVERCFGACPAGPFVARAVVPEMVILHIAFPRDERRPAFAVALNPAGNLRNVCDRSVGSLPKDETSLAISAREA